MIPLHYAAGSLEPEGPYSKECLEILLKNGADVTSKNNDGNTPFDKSTNDEIKEILKEWEEWDEQLEIKEVECVDF